MNEPEPERILAILVPTNGGGIMRTTVRTRPIPEVILVDGHPFRIRLYDFMITGKAIYSGYYPSRRERKQWDTGYI